VILPQLLGWTGVVAAQSASESYFLAFLVGLHVATALGLMVFYRSTWALPSREPSPGRAPSGRRRPPDESPSPSGAPRAVSVRLVAHAFGRPARIVGELDLHVQHVVQAQERPADLVGQVRTDRTGRCRGGHPDASHAAEDLDAIDEAEVDDVDPELGIDDHPEPLVEVGRVHLQPQQTGQIGVGSAIAVRFPVRFAVRFVSPSEMGET